MHLIFIAAAILAIAPVQPDQPNRQPQLAAAPGLTALVFGSQDSIWFSASHDNGKSFSQPVRVAQVPNLMLRRHRGPRVVIAKNTIVISAVEGLTAPIYNPYTRKDDGSGDLLVWRSTDGGKTWSKPVVINDVPTAAREGLHAMAAGRNGELAAAWLDLRQKGTRLYGAYSHDGGASWSKNVMLYESPGGTICQCCDPSITSTGKEQFQVMFRNVMDGDRDMYLASWDTASGIQKVKKLGTGSWKLNACPMDGGGVVEVNGKTVSAWRREHTVYLNEAGEREIALGDGKDVAIAPSSRGAYVAWIGAAGVEIHKPGHQSPVLLSPSGAYPTLKELANGYILAAWENNGQIETKVLQ